MSLDMALLCPICKSVAQEFDRTGDATGFNCEMDGKLKVANTVFARFRIRRSGGVPRSRSQVATSRGVNLHLI